MASPTAFTLYNGYLDNVLETRLDNMIAHELMHGFASEALFKKYQAFMKSNDYLKKRYSFLINDMRSGTKKNL